MASTEIKNRIEEYVGQLLDNEHFIVGVEQSPGGRKISVYLDGDKGVDIDYCGKISRLVSRMIDEDTSLGDDEKFIFEISSPGVDKPLVNFRQLPKHINRYVAFTLDGKEHTGKLISAADGNFEIDEEIRQEGKKKVAIERLSYEFNENLKLKITIKF